MVCCLSELHIEVYDADAIVLQVMLLRHTLETSVGLDVQRALKWSTESGDSVHKQIRVHGRKGTEEMAQLDGKSACHTRMGSRVQIPSAHVNSRLV